MSFKAYIRFLLEQGIADTTKVDLTNSGYRKAVPRETFILWINEERRNITPVMIRIPFLKFKKGIEKL